jgi:hypothetical protein
MNILPTYQANIFIGLKEGYGGIVHAVEYVEQICQEYVNEIGWCVTVTPTKFIYSGGAEPGVNIGAINYPRFPSTKAEIDLRLIGLADELMIVLNQQRCTIVSTNEIMLLENDSYEERS